MLIVVLAFAVVFLYRDVQVLALPDRKGVVARFAGYAALMLVAVAVMADVPAAQYAWTQKRFALAAVLIQLAELGLALALRKWGAGRHSWVGGILPCPAFLVGLFALSFTIQHEFIGLDAVAATEIVTGCWLAVVAGFALLLSPKEESADRKFVDDFALLTSCTALIFVPYGLF